MPSWKGDITNPVPNDTREPIDRAEKVIAANRAEQVRRDNDKQRDFTISLYDIDEAIFDHLKTLQLQVEDAGQKVNVPVFFGSPEQWTSAQRDGYLRDQQGKVILPIIILKRTTSENDPTLQFFNRYLNTPAIKLYSSKNKYTQFSILAGQNAPVNEVYNIIVPSHMLLTYHFVIWTEYIEQMNTLTEKFQFNTKDYWGSKRGFRFRTRIESFGHTTEVRAGEDRIVKTEFDLTAHGYILPDSIVRLDSQEATAKKMFTPKKIVMGLEVVGTAANLAILDKNRAKWQNPNYPNLQADVPITPPPVSTNLTLITGTIGIKVDNSPLFLRIVPVPTMQNSAGQDGDMSYDAEYFYFHSHGWKRVAISEFTRVCSDTIPQTGTEGNVQFNSQFLYIYSHGEWRKVALAAATPLPSGNEGDVMYDASYFYVYTGGSWRSVSIAVF